jgi:two-component system cell cycle sensor histidine kinase/response regulator CckA
MADNNHVQNFDSFHNKLLGLGKHSLRKSYYPELQKRIEELENIQVELKKYKDHLEELVVERTNKLNIINEQLQREITERKRAEEGLRKSRRELVDIIEFLPDATLVVDKDGKVIAWNRAIEKMTGVKKEDMIGKGNHEYALPFYGDRRNILVDLVLHPDREIEKKYTAIQRAGDTLLGEAFTPSVMPGNVHLSGAASVLRDNNGEITAAIECIRDNTERKRLEERLNRAEKMESLGTLAGGVAHDLNNVLGVLVGYSELLRDELPENSTMRRYADNIVQSGVRGAAIINDLLTLARRGVTISEVVDLNKLVFNYLRTPEFEKLKSYHPEVKIRTHLEDNLLNIKGSPVHLGKTIMNLVSNAAEAISGQGEVTIKTENRYLEHPLYGYEEMKEGDYVVLKVSDTGTGISGNDIKKIFEPFYTKKVMGRSGTGLGLAVVWGTVKDHHGYIDILSKEGEGSTFILYIPVTREKQEQVEEAISPVTYRSRGESILVVDDVKEQRKLTISMLGKLGYQVEAVASGEEAIEYLKNKKADLIILDMIMDPGIDGTETYRRILEINPVQKAVIVSGFSETDRVRNAQEMGAGAFVQKPYVLENIGIAVRKELDRK